MTWHFPLASGSRATLIGPTFSLGPGPKVSHGHSCCCPRQDCSGTSCPLWHVPRKGTVPSRFPANILVPRDKTGSLPGRCPPLPCDITMAFLWLLPCFALLGTALRECWGRRRPGGCLPNPEASRGLRGPPPSSPAHGGVSTSESPALSLTNPTSVAGTL